MMWPVPPGMIATVYAHQTIAIAARCDDSPECSCGCAIDLRDWWDLVCRFEAGELGQDRYDPESAAA